MGEDGTKGQTSGVTALHGLDSTGRNVINCTVEVALSLLGTRSLSSVRSSSTHSQLSLSERGELAMLASVEITGGSSRAAKAADTLVTGVSRGSVFVQVFPELLKRKV